MLDYLFNETIVVNIGKQIDITKYLPSSEKLCFENPSPIPRQWEEIKVIWENHKTAHTITRYFTDNSISFLHTIKLNGLTVIITPYGRQPPRYRLFSYEPTLNKQLPHASELKSKAHSHNIITVFN